MRTLMSRGACGGACVIACKVVSRERFQDVQLFGLFLHNYITPIKRILIVVDNNRAHSHSFVCEQRQNVLGKMHLFLNFVA
jgi:hypothetical protein